MSTITEIQVWIFRCVKLSKWYFGHVSNCIASILWSIILYETKLEKSEVRKFIRPRIALNEQPAGCFPMILLAILSLRNLESEEPVFTSTAHILHHIIHSWTWHSKQFGSAYRHTYCHRACNRAMKLCFNLPTVSDFKSAWQAFSRQDTMYFQLFLFYLIGCHGLKDLCMYPTLYDFCDFSNIMG